MLPPSSQEASRSHASDSPMPGECVGEPHAANDATGVSNTVANARTGMCGLVRSRSRDGAASRHEGSGHRRTVILVAAGHNNPRDNVPLPITNGSCQWPGAKHLSMIYWKSAPSFRGGWQFFWQLALSWASIFLPSRLHHPLREPLFPVSTLLFCVKQSISGFLIMRHEGCLGAAP